MVFLIILPNTFAAQQFWSWRSLLVCRCCQISAKQACWLGDKSLLAQWTLCCHRQSCFLWCRWTAPFTGDYVISMVFELTRLLSSLTAAGVWWSYLWWHSRRYNEVDGDIFTNFDKDADGDCSPHKYSGGHHARDLADFVEDILRPVVLPLTVSETKMMIFRFYT